MTAKPDSSVFRKIREAFLRTAKTPSTPAPPVRTKLPPGRRPEDDCLQGPERKRPV